MTDDDRRLTTTSGVLALANLQAQCDGLAAQLAGARSSRAPAVAERARLVDLLILRGEVLAGSQTTNAPRSWPWCWYAMRTPARVWSEELSFDWMSSGAAEPRSSKPAYPT